jgi:hypothetical protein
LLGVACSCLLFVVASASAADVCPTGCPLSGQAIRPQDEVWAINTRGLCGTSPKEVIDGLPFEQYVPGQGWTRRSFADFAIQPHGDLQTEGATQPKSAVTCFFVVGNDYTHPEILQTGWYAYHQLVACRADDVAVRFVLWSWPSDRVPGRRLNDAQLKFTRIDPSAFRLAVLVDRLDPAIPVTMCGSSFGAGITGGALQLLAGGRLGPYQLAAARRPARQIRLVLMGAAIHNDALLPGRKYGMALSQTERTLVFVNPADLALRVYHRLFSRRRVVAALGLTGPAGLPRSPDRSRVDLVWSNSYVGRKHGMMPYWQSPTLVARMRPYLLMQGLPSKQ